ncbi:3-oxoacyl-[acyl-carrier protein] reductase [Gracilibacillus ureilyticus]|uniref:3-oxoacyl-[acyl-carrier protein] reductase n=1 Tax=Gracilibacillus ureilyticus TaxID=531814 RepID=A0A1H9W3V4_9BACI|nr:SDR family oxidoreductase [Gracilibacillus ureilyticus]SES28620.1 3-oxoacyl-[acyl-carrier protein] reductase [Gracilibacillus ureilyticus]
MQHLKGKIAIITGASRSKSIGAAICLSLAEAGVDVFFSHWSPFDKNEGCGLEENFPEELCEKIKSFGVRSAHMSLDLSLSDSHKKLLDTVEDTLGPANVLINNATYESRVNFRELSAEILDKHYQVNNSGTIMLSVEFAKRYEIAYPDKKDGRIINLVSGGPDPNNLAYIATKGMTIAITEPLSVALAPIGITVNSINPGPTDSGWMTEEIKHHLLPQFPSGRLGEPDDAAKIIRFLASDDSYWMTGQTIRAEGGFLGK